ncbi:hypothetical protein BaRGS_00029504, partial [Batillaria attramentaria]
MELLASITTKQAARKLAWIHGQAFWKKNLVGSTRREHVRTTCLFSQDLHPRRKTRSGGPSRRLTTQHHDHSLRSFIRSALASGRTMT